MHGKFIVFEGPDGSGTSLQARLFAEKLRKEGKGVLLTAEPTDGPIGEEIRTILHGDTLPSPEAMQLLFCADRAEHVKSVIEPALKEGKTVISDRYALSTIVYGSALGLDPQWLTQINDAFVHPDLTIITLPSLEVCLERVGRRKKLDQFEQKAFLQRIYEIYAQTKDPTIIFADTSDEKKKVADQIWKEATEYFDPISREKIKELGS
jgi:dTMP kinase